MTSYEEFKQKTLPRLQLKKIVKIQALIRGGLVRRKRWPEIVKWHMGAIKCVDRLVDRYIEDTFLPDLVLELLTKNRVHENLDLYSKQNRILYDIRQGIFERVVRQMVQLAVREAQSSIVNNYLRERQR